MEKRNNNRNDTNWQKGTCIVVTAEECNGNTDKMLRRFSKKVKSDGILEDFRARSHFIKPSFIRAEKKRNKKRIVNKVNKQREELINFTGSRTIPTKRRK